MGDRSPDAPQADNAERCAAHVVTEQRRRMPRDPFAVLDVADALDNPAGGCQQQGEGEVSGRLGEDAGCVADDDPACVGGLHVDVVVADCHLADHLELRSGGVHQGGVDAVGQHTEQAIDAMHALQQSRVGRWQFILPQIDGANSLKAIKLGDGTGDEDVGFHC